MAIICPTVTSESIDTFKQQLLLVSSFANRIHLDIMDGDFAPTTSPMPDPSWIPKGKDIDVHVMHRNPSNVIEVLTALQPNLLIFHFESNIDIPKTAALLREKNIKTGVAVLPETSIDEVRYVLPHVQHVLIFGGHLGYHGGQADLSQLAKVDELLSCAPHVEISWDGGATIDNCAQITSAGVNVLNVGSGIHAATSPKNAYEQFVALTK